MANVDHSTLTGADLHEPKGADLASADMVYAADGAGSGAWTKITTDNLDATNIFTTNKLVMTCVINDVSAVEVAWLIVPCNCTLNKVYTVLHGAIATADDTITIKNHAGSTAATITVAFSGSAAGDMDSTAVTSNNTFSQGQHVTFDTDGASTNSVKLQITAVFTVTGSIG